MGSLRLLGLNKNKIATIEPDAFKDLVNLENLQLFGNKIVTLDEKLFAPLKKMDYLTLSDNKIQNLRPNIFKIVGGKLTTVNLEGNVCIDSLYSLSGWFMGNNFEKLERDLAANCKLQQKSWDKEEEEFLKNIFYCQCLPKNSELIKIN